MRSLKTIPLLLVAASASLVSDPASACGGFFCSSSNPVNQAAEQIVFSHNGDGTVSAIIQIQYQGPSERFAWVLPVPGIPDIGVSSNSALATLSNVTSPQYQLNYTYEGQCEVDLVFSGTDGAVPPAPDVEEAPNDPVTVLDSGSVGPFDYVVIQPDAELEQPAEVAVSWLADNQYDVSSIAPDVLGPYLADGLNLVAFRLTKGNEAGAIRPVMLTYEGDTPSIPIRPTAVAANADMGVQVWVLGEGRAIPENYYSVELNEARINWFNWRDGYDALVSEAADEAGGHGFVTEYAGTTDVTEDTLWNDSTQEMWDAFSATEYTDGWVMMDEASNAYRRWDGFRDAIGEATTLPEGVTLDDFGRNPDEYRDHPDLVIDIEVFREKLFELVIEPVMLTQELLDSRPTMTRLYSTLSPEEMTVDPVFNFNLELPDVDRFHEADITLHCEPGIYQWEAPWTITLQNGTVLKGTSQQWPVDLAMTPAVDRVLQDFPTGTPEVIVDNLGMIDDMIDEMQPDPEPTDTEQADPTSPDDPDPEASDPISLNPDAVGDDDTPVDPDGDGPMSVGDDSTPGDRDTPTLQDDDSEPNDDASDVAEEMAGGGNESSSGCSFTAARSPAPLSSALGVVGLVGLGLLRLRRQR